MKLSKSVVIGIIAMVLLVSVVGYLSVRTGARNNLQFNSKAYDEWFPLASTRLELKIKNWISGTHSDFSKLIITSKNKGVCSGKTDIAMEFSTLNIFEDTVFWVANAVVQCSNVSIYEAEICNTLSCYPVIERGRNVDFWDSLGRSQ